MIIGSTERVPHGTSFALVGTMLTTRVSAAAIILISMRSVRAETDAPRTLVEHQFVPSSLVPWGFVDSSFAMTSTAGYVQYDQDSAARVTAGSRSELRLIALAHSFSGTARLAPWLGLNGRVTAAVDIPRGLESALAVGAHTNLGVEGGAVLNLVRVSGLQLSARGDVGWAEERNVVPMFLPDALLITGDVVTIQPSLIAAFAISPVIGLQASATYTWRRFDIEDTDSVQSAAVAAAATLALTPIPLTLLGGGQLHRLWGRDNESVASSALFGTGGTQTRLEGGVFYTGRRDLDLGAVVTAQFGRNDDRRYLGNIRMGYYF
jgi:hypothetical protein